jgi:hypothetical protein
MNRRSLVSLSAMTVLGVFALSTAIAQQKSLKDQLVGTWTLVANETTPGGHNHVFYLVPPYGIRGA